MDSSQLKLGKKPPTEDSRDIKFSFVRSGITLPTPPDRFGHGLMFKDWGMLGNDQYGDCVFAGAGHETMLTTRLGGHPVDISTEAVLMDYHDVTGFDPDDPDTDQGTYVRDALSYRRHTGVRDAALNRHKIGAYVSIDPKSWDDLMTAAYVFSAVGIGFAFPDTAFEQFDAHMPWDVVDGANIEGGHYVPVFGRNARNTGGCVSWGRRVGFTRDFYEEYNDETWAMIFPEELRNGRTERGMNLQQLEDALAAL